MDSPGSWPTDGGAGFGIIPWRLGADEGDPGASDGVPPTVVIWAAFEPVLAGAAEPEQLEASNAVTTNAARPSQARRSMSITTVDFPSRSGDCSEGATDGGSSNLTGPVVDQNRGGHVFHECRPAERMRR